MRQLNGSELAGFIKERQAHQVRSLRQGHKILPKLAIILTNDDPVIGTYVRLKKHYGADILIDVDIHGVAQPEVAPLIEQLNKDDSVHGIIIQLPLTDTSETEKLVNMVAPEKDVDALGEHASFDPATPMAINWLLAGYNVELANKNIVLVGHGRLVGAPLARMWRTSNLTVTVVDRSTEDMKSVIREADVLVTAAGAPGLITSDMIKPDTVVVDAAVASEDGKLAGDLAAEVRERGDLMLTPEKGGVGPLTVCALFENVIRAASAHVPKV
jgi:methylenetetrahydrofolate dehydrogenase (NADP+)/methenyltetrahydrofolate cyclohydrolase